MIYTFFAFLIVVAYLLGSIPFGLLIARAHDKDLRAIGSGNIGATNVARALGRKWGYLCFMLDMIKGLVPMLAAKSFFTTGISGHFGTESVIELWLWLGVGIAAILGHIFPIYLKFKGGKGVATSFGVALGLWPYYTICAIVAIAIWLLVVLLWRYVSLASITASIAFPLVLFLAIVLSPDWDIVDLWPLLIVAAAIPLMVIIRHKKNIKRLLTGTENKLLQKRGAQEHKCTSA
jgi:glycerol-3-phosphate acyltransferase PlsY